MLIKDESEKNDGIGVEEDSNVTGEGIMSEKLRPGKMEKANERVDGIERANAESNLKRAAAEVREVQWTVNSLTG